jgi:hypothetical protein
MYPFDRYFFAFELTVFASVTSLSNPNQTDFQTGVPVLVAFSDNTPAFEYSQIDDADLLSRLSVSLGFRSSAQGQFFFPPTYFHGVPNMVTATLTYEVIRSTMIVMWVHSYTWGPGWATMWGRRRAWVVVAHERK